MFQAEHFKKILPGLELYNQKKFWECHEELEAAWLEDKQDPVRNTYWAVIQAAAAMVHYREKNLKGCISLWSKAKEKLDRCENLNVESDFLERVMNWSDFKFQVRKIKDAPELSDFDDLYTFQFEIKE